MAKSTAVNVIGEGVQTLSRCYLVSLVSHTKGLWLCATAVIITDCEIGNNRGHINTTQMADIFEVCKPGLPEHCLDAMPVLGVYKMLITNSNKKKRIKKKKKKKKKKLGLHINSKAFTMRLANIGAINTKFI